MYTLKPNTKVKFLKTCDVIPYMGWNHLKNINFSQEQLDDLELLGWTQGYKNTGVYVLEKALTKEGKLLLHKQEVQANHILEGKYLKQIKL